MVDGLGSAIAVSNELTMTIGALFQIASQFQMIIDSIFLDGSFKRFDIAFLKVEQSYDKICIRNIAFLPSLFI